LCYLQHHAGAIIFSFNLFHKIVSPGACGLTLDWQKLSNGNEICQWLWSRPVIEEIASLPEAQLLELGSTVPETAKQLNLLPVDPQMVGLNLPNEVAVLDHCPFNADSCTGKHIVASGSGIISS
jgi:hypothetical protein